MKGRTIALVNQKGGVGKTTTTFNLGACLAEQGKKVLLVDLNDQGNLTFCFGWDAIQLDNMEHTIPELMMKVIEDQEYNIEDYIREGHNMEYIACNVLMSTVELHIISAMSREHILKAVLAEIKDDYDYILLDCGPTLGMITINALVAADSVLIPSEAEAFSYVGMSQLIMSVLRVRKVLNPSLDIEGILFTKTRKNYGINKEYIDRIHAQYGDLIPIFEYSVPMLTEVSKSIAKQQPLTIYKSSKIKEGQSQVAEVYRRLASEVIRHE